MRLTWVYMPCIWPSTVRWNKQASTENKPLKQDVFKSAPGKSPLSKYADHFSAESQATITIQNLSRWHGGYYTLEVTSVHCYSISILCYLSCGAFVRAPSSAELKPTTFTKTKAIGVQKYINHSSFRSDCIREYIGVNSIALASTPHLQSKINLDAH